MARKTKQDWLEGGLAVLARGDRSQLTIDRLAEELQVTKGSFYHHFQNARDFETQLIAHWSEQFLANTGTLPDDPAILLPLLDMVIAEAFGPTTAPEIAIRTWAQGDAVVREAVQRVDAARRGFLLHTFRALTGDEEKARLMADMLFAILIGCLTTLPRVPVERVQELYNEFKQLYQIETSRREQS